MKTALITGSGTRLGLEFARHLASRGYALILHSNNSTKTAEAYTVELNNRGTIAYNVPADFSTNAGIQQLIDRTKEILGSRSLELEVIINSAAVMRSVRIGEISSDEIDQVMSINFKAPFLISQALIPFMKQNGVVINISDVGAEKIWLKYPIYSLSKNILTQSVKFFAKQFSPKVRMNTLSLGIILQDTNTTANVWEHLIQKVPLKRAGQINEVISGIDFLIDNEYVTGQTIIIDGGRSLEE
jgi:pteridine reductase